MNRMYHAVDITPNCGNRPPKSHGEMLRGNQSRPSAKMPHSTPPYSKLSGFRTDYRQSTPVTRSCGREIPVTRSCVSGPGFWGVLCVKDWSLRRAANSTPSLRSASRWIAPSERTNTGRRGGTSAHAKEGQPGAQGPKIAADGRETCSSAETDVSD